MDDNHELVLKKICCTCLSRDRKLFQLCRVNNGVNILYLLLTFDSEAYREGFYKDAGNLFVCWECRSIVCKISHFRDQACFVQKQLSSIEDGRTDLQYVNTCYTRLSGTNTVTFDKIFPPESTSNIEADNFIDCGPTADTIKSEDDDLEDVPLSELNCDEPYNNLDEELHKNIQIVVQKGSVEKRSKKKKLKKSYLSEEEQKKYFATTLMNEEEMLESREKRKLVVSYANASWRCESCLEGFRNLIASEKHNLYYHTEKPKHTQCPICLCYVKPTLLQKHEISHYQYHKCQFCEFISYSVEDILHHLKSKHAIQKLAIRIERKAGQRATPFVKNPGSRPRRNVPLRDKRTPFGYKCPDCEKYFETRAKRWKHIQANHREKFKCKLCGKEFAFKHVLDRHEQLHITPEPRSECETCHKMIRADLMKKHVTVHGARQKFTCVQCDKLFISQASYENHLKYTQTHAPPERDILKFKCTMCDKGYRSRGELRDHIDYNHRGITQHKCPICGKALATRRCVHRHIKRTHNGVKENAKDKICQQCGKAFRDKKNLREHEFIHTGERPLSCEICGCTFRQHASLYTHKKRVHKIFPAKKHVELVENVETAPPKS